MADKADGRPTKEFFINMLTRDIALEDAILDLLDNCLDGVIRVNNAKGKQIDGKYYEGFAANITISQDVFQIEDNCGGIPRGLAENYAFRMGRDPDLSETLPTIGIYGIGMKRAIFKIGKEASVISKQDNTAFSVTISEGWANDGDDWGFPIVEENSNILAKNGTRIIIHNFTDGIAEKFNFAGSIDIYTDDLIKYIKANYSLIIEKGFTITVNESQISAHPIELYASNSGNGINPYIFKKIYDDDVNVSLAVGFYDPPPTEEDIDASNESKRSSAEAGWTIVCNDRIILYNDKSHLTGWGEAGVPHYHTQFIGIRGIVVFESKSPKKLPMTTTKRGIDLSSPIYADVKNRMRDGLKIFTNYTNQWKGRKEQERMHYAGVEKISTTSLIRGEYTQSFDYKAKHNGQLFQPTLPKPETEKNYEIIRFSRSKDEIDSVRGFFTNGDESILMVPSKVGERCFELILDKISGGN